MTKHDKLLKRIRNNPKNVTFEELRTLLEAYGFEIDTIRGSHHTFRNRVGGVGVKLVIPYKKPYIKQVYVKQAIALIEQILSEEE
jgi:predicted RNA binding protein YcfA (HicA-like mRNA interferase family)